MMVDLKRAAASLALVLLAVVAAAQPASAQSTILFCVSEGAIVRIEFTPGQPEVFLDDLRLPASVAPDMAIPGPFVTRVGDAVLDYELQQIGAEQLLRTTRIRLPIGTTVASVGQCRSITTSDIAPRSQSEPVVAFGPIPGTEQMGLAFEDMGNPVLMAAISNGDIAAGEQVAMQCAGCHSLGEGEANRFGPNLYGLVYRVVGSHEGFTYSPALTALEGQGAVWTFAGLDAFLTNPQVAIPGTTMPFGGIADASDRANLIAYLRAMEAPDRWSVLEQPRFGVGNPTAPDLDRLAALIDPAAIGVAQGAAGTRQIPEGQRAALIAMIRSAVARCWNPGAGWTNPADVRVVLQFRLNRDGAVQGIPQIIERPDGAFGQAAAESAQRAIYVCAPYQLPADLYDGQDGWREVRLIFDPREMF